jgi:hypothetical protein
MALDGVADLVVVVMTRSQLKIALLRY